MNIDLNGNTITDGYFSGVGEDLTALNATNLTSGTVADARLTPNGALLTDTNAIPPAALVNGGTTPNNVTFYRGDGTWQAPGSITALTGFKNLLIGGDFSTNPWQRGTSFTGLVCPAYTADRWGTNCNVSGSQTVIRQTGIVFAALRCQRCFRYRTGDS